MDARRKKLRFRSWHRGTREMDLLIGQFADRFLAAMTAAQLDRFEALLDVADPEILAWIAGRASVPADHDHDVTRWLLDFRIDSARP